MTERERLQRIRSRLMRAVRFERPSDLRAAIVDLASDIEAMLEGRPVADEQCPATLPRPPRVPRDLKPPRAPTDLDARDTWPSAELPEFVEDGPASPAVPCTRPSGGA
jgi:hypothetical protein